MPSMDILKEDLQLSDSEDSDDDVIYVKTTGRIYHQQLRISSQETPTYQTTNCYKHTRTNSEFKPTNIQSNPNQVQQPSPADVYYQHYMYYTQCQYMPPNPNMGMGGAPRPMGMGGPPGPMGMGGPARMNGPSFTNFSQPPPPPPEENDSPVKNGTNEESFGEYTPNQRPGDSQNNHPINNPRGQQMQGPRFQNRPRRMGQPASSFMNPEWEKARQALEKVQSITKSPTKPVQSNPNQVQQPSPADVYYQHYMYYTQCQYMPPNPNMGMGGAPRPMGMGGPPGPMGMGGPARMNGPSFTNFSQPPPPPPKKNDSPVKMVLMK
ncbi:THP3 [Mytilus coruscus]|uniref:THP3 n=1 Tax=Mytilus coruscus TaxID=42192 RepID=A0A6J8BNH5_MYTCO|nr:THP3 [Mytilus coruscus]